MISSLISGRPPRDPPRRPFCLCRAEGGAGTVPVRRMGRLCSRLRRMMDQGIEYARGLWSTLEYLSYPVMDLER